jgi:hypothetical protein
MIRIHLKGTILKIPAFTVAFIFANMNHFINTSYDWLLLTMFLLIDCIIDIG